MVKRKDLKAKLKAADKRRRNRQADAPKVAGPRNSSGHSVDVAGLFVEAILRLSGKNHLVRDTIVLSALRCVQRSAEPKSDDVLSLHQHLMAVSRRKNVTDRMMRDAASELLEIAKTHSDEQAPDQFLRYLTVLSDYGTTR